MKNSTSKRLKFGLYFLLFGGIVLRLLVFFQNRSLFIDEANLARNIAERSFAGLFQNLDYEQYAPPFFASVVKGFTLVFGNTEYAFRAFSLLCGIGGLFVFYKLIVRLSSDIRLAWYPIVLMAFSFSFVQYSTEVKQYACDVLVALSLLYIATDKRFSLFEQSSNPSKLFVCWSVIGTMAIWFSMPSIFFLAAIGIAFFIKSLRKKGMFLIPVVVVGGTWLLSFGLYYWMILSGDIGDDNLKDYHAQFFFPMMPTSIADVQQAWALIRQLFGSTFGSTTAAIAWGIISVTTGVLILWHKNKRLLWLLCFPIILVLVASSIHYYSLIKRLTLFFLPNLMLLSWIGTAFLFPKANRYLKVLILAVLGLICFNQKGYPYFTKALQIEELRPLLYDMKTDWMPTDVVYIHHEAVHAFAFYREHFRAKEDFDYFGNATILHADWQQREVVLLKFLSKNKVDKLGLVFSHASETEVQRVLMLLKEQGNINMEKRTTGASYFVLEMNPLN